MGEWLDISSAPSAEFVLVGYFLGYVTYAWFNSAGNGLWENANGDVIRTPDKWMPKPNPPRNPNGGA